jgi:hypothetical protein
MPHKRLYEPSYNDSKHFRSRRSSTISRRKLVGQCYSSDRSFNEKCGWPRAPLKSAKLYLLSLEEFIHCIRFSPAGAAILIHDQYSVRALIRFVCPDRS